jgi:hypothetical protein
LTLAVWVLSVQPARSEGWSLGRLWPFGQNKIQPAKAVKKVGSGTKRAFYKTKQALSFKDDPPPSQFAGWRENQEYRRTGSTDDEEPGFFSSLFRPADPPRPSKTIKDFMSQKRVEP